MSARKVLITYKRRRNLEGGDAPQENVLPDPPLDLIPEENGLPDLPVDPSSDTASNTSDKHEELPGGNKSEDSEHDPKGKRLCTGSVNLSGDSSIGGCSAVPSMDLNVVSEADPVIPTNATSCFPKYTSKRKLTSPVITFCRRSKLNTDENHAVQISNKDVNNTSPSTNLVPGIGSSVEQAEKEPGSTSKDNPCAVEVVLPQDSGSNHSLQSEIGGELAETPADARNSLNDAEAGPSHEPVLPTCHVSVAQNPQSSATADLNRRRVADQNISDSPVEVDCNIALEPRGEELPVRSLEPRGEELPVRSLQETRNRDSMELVRKNNELTIERMKQLSSSQLAQERGNGSSSKQVVGAKNYNSSKSSQVLGLKNNCLQQFPEGSRAVNKSVGKATACADSRRKLLSLQSSSSRKKTTAAKTSRFVPPSMPMEPLVVKQAGGSTTPQWPNLVIQPRVLSEGGIAPEYTSSYLRQRVILDSFSANRGRAGGGNRSNIVERIDLPWSEDELDCLWMGVRRHGRGNWDTILKDITLHFLPCRTARDLSERWEVEQCKISSSLSFPTSRPQVGLGTYLTSRPQVVGLDTFPESKKPQTGKQISLFDMLFSVGGSSSQQRSDPVKRSQFSFPINNLSNLPTPPGDVEVPRWLKEVVAVPSKPSPSTAPPSGTPSIRFGEAPWTKPLVDPSGSDQGPINEVSLNRRLPDSAELLNVNRALSANTSPATGTGNSDRGKNKVWDLNVVVIDGDTSSEETVSDHRGGRA